MFKWVKQLKELIRPIKVRVYLALLALFVLVGLIMQQFQFVGVILFVLILIYLSKQGEEENKILQADEHQTKKMEELKRLEKRIEVLRDHVKESKDLETKLKLADMEVEYETLKNQMQ